MNYYQLSQTVRNTVLHLLGRMTAPESVASSGTPCSLFFLPFSSHRLSTSSQQDTSRNQPRASAPPPDPPLPLPLVCGPAVKTAFDVDAKMIVVLTETGTTPRLIAKYRPSMPILALTAIPETVRPIHSTTLHSTGASSILQHKRRALPFLRNNRVCCQSYAIATQFCPPH